MDTPNMFSLPDLNKFTDPHCLPLFNNFGPNAKAPNPITQQKKKTRTEPTSHTTEPYVTGTSVLGIKFKGGVMLACDTLASYGSLARFRDVRRMAALGNHTLIGSTGEYSDFQYLIRLLDELVVEDQLNEDGASYSPHSIHSYLTRVLYNRRNKMDPLWGQFVVGGYKDGESFLGLADMKGTNYVDDHIATGYGSMIARPLMRQYYKKDMSKDEAKRLLEECLRVLYYRDARALNRIQIATVSDEGTVITEPYELQTNWDVGVIEYKGEMKNADFVFTNSNSKIH